MQTIRFDLKNPGKAFKPLNATNGGPWHKRHATDQWRSNFKAYQAARMPYSRNHDSNICGSVYGGPYAHDISAIFPNFDADPYDPASYDFACTDEDILCCLDAGTKTFFRLGQSIEHQIKKHHIYPPKDFKKWAIICEHIIRHYTEGWADGFTHDMPYWEIWNEPDLDINTANKRCWGGTTAEFFDFFEVAAKYLKGCFPHLKIGGPALCGNVEWGTEFLKEMHQRNVPLDFFSWHVYGTTPEKVMARAAAIREAMDTHGYSDAESILNEWNYIRGWEADFAYSIQSIGNQKGAAFTMAVISEAQKSSIDMLMYYDTRPGAFCGPFDVYSYEPKKPYYALYWYGMFYDMTAEIPALDQHQELYSLCGIDEEGKLLAVVTHYSEDDNTAPKTVRLDFGRSGDFEIFLVDAQHDNDIIPTPDDLTFTLPVDSMILIKEK